MAHNNEISHIACLYGVAIGRIDDWNLTSLKSTGISETAQRRTERSDLHLTVALRGYRDSVTSNRAYSRSPYCILQTNFMSCPKRLIGPIACTSIKLKSVTCLQYQHKTWRCSWSPIISSSQTAMPFANTTHLLSSKSRSEGRDTFIFRVGSPGLILLAGE